MKVMKLRYVRPLPLPFGFLEFELELRQSGRESEKTATFGFRP